MSRRRAPRVSIKWEARTDEEGRRYAILRWTEDGARKNRRIGYQTPESAEDLRAQHAAALLLQVASPIDSAAVATVASVLDAYLVDLDGRPISPAYGAGELARCVTLRRLLGTVAADRVTSQTLARYLGDRRRETTNRDAPPKRSSLTMELDTLRRAFRSAIDQRLIPGPVPEPPSGKLPQDRRPPRRLTEAEIGRLVEAGHRDVEYVRHGGRDRYDGLGWLVQVLAWSGRRPIAVLELTVDDLARVLDPRVAREDQLVRWRRDKGGEGLGLGPITEPAREALLARAEEVGTGRLWLFPASKALHYPFARLSRATGIPDVEPYDLRRFACTRILQGVGQNLKEAARYTGHTDERTLLRYQFLETASADAKAARIGWTPEPLRLVADVVADDRGSADDGDL